jgi:hypothetical protein
MSHVTTWKKIVSGSIYNDYKVVDVRDQQSVMDKEKRGRKWE